MIESFLIGFRGDFRFEHSRLVSWEHQLGDASLWSSDHPFSTSSPGNQATPISRKQISSNESSTLCEKLSAICRTDQSFLFDTAWNLLKGQETSKCVDTFRTAVLATADGLYCNSHITVGRLRHGALSFEAPCNPSVLAGSSLASRSLRYVKS